MPTTTTTGRLCVWPADKNKRNFTVKNVKKITNNKTYFAYFKKAKRLNQAGHRRTAEAAQDTLLYHQKSRAGEINTIKTAFTAACARKNDHLDFPRHQSSIPSDLAAVALTPTSTRPRGGGRVRRGPPPNKYIYIYILLCRYYLNIGHTISFFLYSPKKNGRHNCRAGGHPFNSSKI